MNSQDKVSILIPVHNRENIIGQTIESALSQTYQNLEIIIVDNSSTDNTLKMIAKYEKRDKRIKIFKNHTNIGPVRNWKRCIDEASGVFGKILWSDDLIAPEFIEKTIGYLKNNSNIGFVFTGTEIFYQDTDKKINMYFIGESGVYDSEEYIQGILREGSYPYSPGCALFRLKDLKENLLIDIPNKVNSDFSMHAIGNDLLIFLLTANKYKKFAFINEKLSYFRAHNNSLSVQSNNGKLQLFYNLATAYFVENYRNDLIRKMNTRILLTIKRFLIAKKYNLANIDNYYFQNTNFKIDFIAYINAIVKQFLLKVLLWIKGIK
ncbi:MAG: glycosyltransferase family 2 protein [Bacteroidales bacterium]|nr:glycosyltransferase family 2 protein [Bacteroidales bacterium]